MLLLVFIEAEIEGLNFFPLRLNECLVDPLLFYLFLVCLEVDLTLLVPLCLRY